MESSILAIVVGGLVTILGSYITTRLTTGATMKNYMSGGSQKDLGDAASKYADATAKTAELNGKLTNQLDMALEKSARLEEALTSANAVITALKKDAEEDEERRKGILMSLGREIKDLRTDLARANERLQKQNDEINDLLQKQYQLADNYSGVAKENKRLLNEINNMRAEYRQITEWVTQARQIFSESNIQPPLLEIKI